MPTFTIGCGHKSTGELIIIYLYILALAPAHLRTYWVMNAVTLMLHIRARTSFMITLLIFFIIQISKNYWLFVIFIFDSTSFQVMH